VRKTALLPLDVPEYSLGFSLRLDVWWNFTLISV
jgi:hypothetical protein